MTKKTIAYWIRHQAEYDHYEFECSICGTCFLDTEERCPHCDSVMQEVCDCQIEMERSAEN